MRYRQHETAALSIEDRRNRFVRIVSNRSKKPVGSTGTILACFDIEEDTQMIEKRGDRARIVLV
ncbi:MAG: hypothetical protein WCB63_14735, partial [Polyangiales bacterium]